MKNRNKTVIALLLSVGLLTAGCSGDSSHDGAVQESAAQTGMSQDETVQEGTAQTDMPQDEDTAVLPDGVYTADFDTDNSMFRVNESCDGKGTLTVEDGKMRIHVSLGSKNIVNLYCGLAEDAKEDGGQLLEPTTDSVTYSDGWTEEVYGFDIPVPVLDEEFPLALIGTKGTWYDHKVVVSNPCPLEEAKMQTMETEAPGDGIYTVDITLEGGSGKAEILSPVTITVKEGIVTAKLVWNSPNYDYMLADGVKYLPVNTQGDSVFEIPVPYFDRPVTVIGDTVAMSKPHEVEYTITFLSDTMEAAE